jgi:Na+/melibiose symporter-like transporter
MLALKPGVQAEMIGWRSVFYRLSNVFCNSALIAIPGFIYDWTKEQGNENMPLAWQITMGITTVIFALMAIWHIFSTPRPTEDQPNKETNAKKIISDFGQAFSTFFKKPALWVAILFMLLYRLPEGFLLKMLYPFLFATREMGGLGMSNQEFALVYGTFGVIFLLLGGILGGFFISRAGLKKSFWWMALAMTLPCLTFVYLSEFLPTNMISISIAIAIEQFGYGFGFTAYMMYMMYFSDGEFKTSHYAICTSFMALSMLLPGMVAGYIQEGSSPTQKTIDYTTNESISLSAPIGYDKDMFYFNGWKTVSVDSAGNFVEELYAKSEDTIVVKENKNLYASFSTMKFVKYSIEFVNPSKNTVLCDFKLDTVDIPYAIEQNLTTQTPIGEVNFNINIKADTICQAIPLAKLYTEEQLGQAPIDSTQITLGLFIDSISPIIVTEHQINDTIVLQAPISNDYTQLKFSGWAYANGDTIKTDTLIITEDQILYASYDKIQIAKYNSEATHNTNMLLYTIKADTIDAPLDHDLYEEEKDAEKENPHRLEIPIGKTNIYTDLKLDTIFTNIPLTELYTKEQLLMPVSTSADGTTTLQFITAKGKMSDYRWFFWMVICCSAATFLVTFLAWRRVDSKYGKK